MKRKNVGLIVSLAVAASLMNAPVSAEERIPALTVQEVQADQNSTKSDNWVDGSALLSDYDYQTGILTEEGWENQFLQMAYVPDGGKRIGIRENQELNTYYGRFGKDRMIAVNELVVKDDQDGYLQLMVEVNPNHEKAEDVLKRFVNLEELEMVSITREIDVAGKKMLTCTGVYEKEKYLLGISTDPEDLVLALKMRYESVDARKSILNGFLEYDGMQTESLATENSNNTISFDDMQLTKPEAFSEAAVIEKIE